MSAKICILDAHGNMLRWVKRSELAEWTKEDLVRRTSKVYALRNPLTAKQQARTYQEYAIDTHPQLVQGGLTRTETQPNPKPGILTWGHIGESK